MKIASLQIENVKRVKAVRLEPTNNGLTIVGGNNDQGKTTVLDAIAWALGGAKFAPSNAQRDGSVNPPSVSVTLDNGIKVERRGKNAALHVTDPSGKKAGQALLDSFVSQFALDLPKFMDSSAREKAETLLQIIGIGDELKRLEDDEKRLYNERHAIGQISEQKKKYAAELPEYPDAPDEPVSVSDLIKRQQEILATNGENQRKRENRDRLRTQVETLRSQLAQAEADLAIAEKSASDLSDESTAQIESSIADIEGTNERVRANKEKARAQDEAETYASQYEAKTAAIEAVREQRRALLEGAELPLPGLCVVEGELVYNGRKWDGISGSDRLRVATAIVRKLNPNCEFVLMDKLEQFDIGKLKEFHAWLEGEGLQVIATRVSTGEECALIIEDGLPQGQTYVEVVTAEDDKKWEW